MAVAGAAADMLWIVGEGEVLPAKMMRGESLSCGEEGVGEGLDVDCMDASVDAAVGRGVDARWKLPLLRYGGRSNIWPPATGPTAAAFGRAGNRAEARLPSLAVMQDRLDIPEPILSTAPSCLGCSWTKACVHLTENKLVVLSTTKLTPVHLVVLIVDVLFLHAPVCPTAG